MNQEWSIQSRSNECAATQKPFEEDEYFYTLLFEEKGDFRREDLSEEAFKARAEDAQQPFSFWKSKYEAPPPPAMETLGKQTAEDLLRKYLEENSPQHTNASYILALMLERKRMLKEVEVRQAEDGRMIRIYEHSKTGEVFLIPDPQLRLDQLAEVQQEVSGMLG